VLRKNQWECTAWVAREQHWRSAGDRSMGCSEKVYPTPPFAWPHEPTNPRRALPIGMLSDLISHVAIGDGPA
jgi:hypothetical protein